MRIAIIGAGPAAFYAAARLRCRVDIFDKLWAPYGLVRYGVAPDHPEVKNCTHKFQKLAEDNNVRFFGNVQVKDLRVFDKYYSHVITATGAPLPRVLADIPSAGPAIDIVHWYTHHPSSKLAPKLGRNVTIIGQGNVSLDVARILLSPYSALEKYDIPESVLAVLAQNPVEHVSIIGRRGPLQAAFTIKEVRELVNLPDVHMRPIPSSLLEPAFGTELTRQQSRILELLKKSSRKSADERKSFSLEFFKAPLAHSPLSKTLTLSHTTLSSPTTQVAVPSGETSTQSTDLLVASLGFYAQPWDIPENMKHKVYATGWARTGAKGVLASTMIDANSVADDILTSQSTPDPYEDALPPEIESGLAEKRITTFSDWFAIDAEEIRRGEKQGKERERMQSWEQVREFLDSRQ